MESSLSKKNSRRKRGANIFWKDIENLLVACGAEISEGRGSRVRIVLNDVRHWEENNRHKSQWL